MADQIQTNTYAWAEDGRKVYVKHITTEGYYVVEGMEAQVYGDEVYEECGSMWVAAKLYAQPPKPVIDEQIEKAKAELEQVREKYREVTNAVYSAERENKERFAKLSKYNGLENIEAFIDGKITHVVIVEGYYGPIVKKFDEVASYMDDRGWNTAKVPAGIKLISLYGNSKGDLMWQLFEYKDGSGSSKRIYPFESEEAAVVRRNELLVEGLTEAMKMSDASQREYYVLTQVRRMRDVGLPVPNDASVIADLKAKKTLAANLKELEKQQLALDEKRIKMEAGEW